MHYGGIKNRFLFNAAMSPMLATINWFCLIRPAWTV